jgi:FtsZ-binding cell division protein ZapB
MDAIQLRTTEVLQYIARRLREVPLLGELSVEVERLARGIEEPCVVAVVGRVKAGKSTFINTLLGHDLAMVGTTETTATINYFRYGLPEDPLRPVRCHYRGGGYTDHDESFLKSLQGHDLDTLKRAADIAYLEYFRIDGFLKRITLVDTPGTEAVVEEHQNRTAEFMKLSSQLRERQGQETQRIGGEADAVIYLIGQVAKANDQAFLEEFSKVTGGHSRALNALGVMAKIDLQPELLERRQELSAKIARQLKDTLNTVVPVSSEIDRGLSRLTGDDGAALKGFVSKLRSIPPATLDLLLSDEELFLEYATDDWPVSAAERQQLRYLGAQPPWGVSNPKPAWAAFAAIARAAARQNISTAGLVQELKDISGFAPLQKLLEEQFFKRGHILRCYRIVGDVRRLLNQIRYVHLPKSREKTRQDRARLERFLDFIRRAGGTSPVGRELEEFVRGQLDSARLADALEGLWEELDEKRADLFHELQEFNADFEVLQRIDEQPHKFSAEELEELRPLLGRSGVKMEDRLPDGKANRQYVRDRQAAWGLFGEESPRGTLQKEIAERAFIRYGLLLDELSRQ